MPVVTCPPSARWVAAMLLVLASAATTAADPEGRFMVKGAGTASCAQFLAAQKVRGPEFISFAGWLDGYLTFLNQSEAGTFDVAPWQGTELLLAAVAGDCRRDPKATFHAAAYRVARGLRPGRLPAKSAPVAALVGEQSVVLYEEVIVRIQQRLKQRGLYDGEASGKYDTATAAALRAFQREKQLPETGLPDQVTLAALL
jgi:pimeloyl-ACP methyl ester carboxylesterase